MKDGNIIEVSSNKKTPILDVSVDIKNLNLHYGDFHAVKNVHLPVYKNQVLALIGPSGCGKSTLLRTINRMNDLVASARVSGEINFEGRNILAEQEDVVALRRKIGMVFQKPNPFPSSVFNNVAWGPRINGFNGSIQELVEWSLKAAGLWDEVKDKLKQSGLALSGGQQQRLCIARAIAMKPNVILMDEPCSALDPISTNLVEGLITELKSMYTIVIVTHNMQQAARVSDYTAFMYRGELIEHNLTKAVFENPKEKLTQDYLSGRFG